MARPPLAIGLVSATACLCLAECRAAQPVQLSRNAYALLDIVVSPGATPPRRSPSNSDVSPVLPFR